MNVLDGGEIDDEAIVDLIGRKYPRRTRTTKVTFAELDRKSVV